MIDARQPQGISANERYNLFGACNNATNRIESYHVADYLRVMFSDRRDRPEHRARTYGNPIGYRFGPDVVGNNRSQQE